MKGHAAIDPDSEIITATVVTPGNAGDASVAEDLLADLLTDEQGSTDDEPEDGDAPADSSSPIVYGDNAYGTGPFQDKLEDAGIESRCKTQQPHAPGGLYSKDSFRIDLGGGTVTCPAGVSVKFRRGSDGGGIAYFGANCTTCPLAGECTRSRAGRTIAIHPYEEALARARQRQRDPNWQSDYRSTRPKVERKLAHMMRRKHGGRRARVRGTERVGADFNLLAAATNLARLAVLGVRSNASGWIAAPA